jgi:hypothetical protein
VHGWWENPKKIIFFIKELGEHVDYGAKGS